MEVRGNEINLFFLYPGLKVSDPALVVCVSMSMSMSMSMYGCV